MTNVQQEALIEKLQKLRAKAEDANISEEEAALYAAKVAELLQKHNLSEAALDIKVEEQEEITEDRMHNGKTNDPWAQSMASAVAELYFCTIYLRTQGYPRKVAVCFVGKPHNIEVAKSMTDYLIKTIGRLANTYANSPAAREDFRWTFTRARNGFERGAGMRMASRIWKMVREQRDGQQQRSNNGNPANLPALYADEGKLVQLWLKEQVPNLRAGRGRGADTSGGHAARGRAAAEGISMNGQIGSKGGAGGGRMLK